MPIPDLPLVTAISYVAPGGRGGSHPVVLASAEGELLHVKFHGNRQGVLTLFHEWLAARLAVLVGAPLPEAKLVVLSQSLLRHPALMPYHVSSGPHFATRYRPSRALSGTHLRRLANRRSLPLALLFESWLFQLDGKGDHLRVDELEGPPKFFVADHGFLFPGGPSWTRTSLAEDADVFPFPRHLLRCLGTMSAADAEAALAQLQGLPEEAIWEAASGTPTEWGIPSWRVDAAARFLTARQRLLVKPYVLLRHLLGA